MRELTKGSPAKVIMTFALPIIFGNLLQQLYNLADGKIVSTYVGTQAFAAVGATAVIANLIIGFVRDLEFRYPDVLEQEIIKICGVMWQEALL